MGHCPPAGIAQAQTVDPVDGAIEQCGPTQRHINRVFNGRTDIPVEHHPIVGNQIHNPAVIWINAATGQIPQ
ncbi:hypothetical protein D3C80_2003270 [compost metagenome]